MLKVLILLLSLNIALADVNTVPATALHCGLFKTEEIEVLIGDGAHGIGTTQYCGIWSLLSRYRSAGAFGNSYSGLLAGELRGRSPRFEILTDHSCRLVHDPTETYPVEVQAVYTLTPPYYIDHTLTIIDKQDMRPNGCDFREILWCNYMNSPEDPNIYFLADGKWTGYMSAEHRSGGYIVPSFLPDSDIEHWPTREEKTRPFYWSKAPVRFDEPFYYGRLGKMVLLFVFDNPQNLRFFVSPSGGGDNLGKPQFSPAWDFLWIIPKEQYLPNKRYTFRLRMIYKRYISDPDILDEVHKSQQHLDFHKPQKLPG